MISNYNLNGFCIANDLFEKNLLTSAYNGVLEVINGEYDTGTPPWGLIDLNKKNQLQRILQAHLANKNILRLLTSSRLGNVAAEITGAKKIKIWGSQLYIKPKNSSSSIVGFHTDYQHMPYFASGVLTAWIPLTKIEKDNGSLIYITKSHQCRQPLPSSGAQIQSFSTQKKQLLDEVNNINCKEYSVKIPLGAGCFHHKNTLHGSLGNTTNKDRYALAVGLLTDKAIFDKSKDDYGYGKHLDNEEICPIIYQ